MRHARFMPTISDNAICIRHWDFSETSQTVSLLTRDHGIVRGIAKGAKREKGPFSGGLDILTRGRLVAMIKPSGGLATLTEWHLETVYRAVRRRLAANRAGLYMADLVHHMLTEHDAHPRLFDALDTALAALDCAAHTEVSLLRFQWALLTECGYQPQLDRDAADRSPLPPDQTTLAFSPASGGVVADTEGPDRWRVRRETIELLRRIASGRAGDDHDAAVASRGNRLLAAYIREILGTELPTLHWTFPDL
jgi:DNA repair protein RecO (recombination protein O)